MFRLIGRHFKEAFQGLFRHFAMAVSSASAVTFTLVLVSLLTLIIGNVSQITKNIEENISVFVKIADEVPEEDIPSLQRQIERIEGVARVEYSDKDAELDRYIEKYGNDSFDFEVYRNDNPLSRAFLVVVESGNSMTEIANKIAAIEGMKEVEFGGTTTENFIRVLSTIRTVGYGIVLALTILAIFLISNTIRITIYNRNKEISIMRQVGASNSYIRQPCVSEGIFIGLMGSVIPVLMTIFGYRYVYETMNGQFISGILTLMPVYPFAYMVAVFLVVVSIVVGLIGSLLSVNKYLRWRR